MCAWHLIYGTMLVKIAKEEQDVKLEKSSELLKYLLF